MSLPFHPDVVISAVERALAQQHVLRRISSQKRRRFALDLAFVALACRSAWLIDIVAVQDPEQVFVDLLRILRQSEVHGVFDSLRYLFESCSQQSFFVNLTRIQSESATDVAFILLRQDPILLVCPPPDVIAALSALATTNPPALAAGLLLGYPVAYVPDVSSESQPFLARTALDVYTCRVRAPTWGSEHTLLKFSCPASLGPAHPEKLMPGRIIAGLSERYEPRVRELGLTLIVVHSVETLDRITL
ncbi:hypothetical protein GGX14DRAFT_447305 [Mycena pura]|uniref:Uncharacterized protein n=1 Tax=Mycena pura TaxID=153505 RepID=A0AAD6VHY2_9AGAR|nr:hypothetical protein GGX14DRAFT_447305 [Mycena pura]